MRKFINSTIVSVIALTVMLLLCSVTAFAAQDYVLYVGDKQVTSDNASDIFGDGTAVYDEESSTLTLDNVTIKTSTELTGVLTGKSPVTFRAMLYAEQSLTINVIGECRLSNDTSENGTYENSYGIVMKGSDTNSPDLTIRGIEMSASRFYIDPNAATGDMTGILAWHSNIYIEKVQLNSSCYSSSYNKGTPLESYGIRAVSNANVLGNLEVILMILML